ncbi:MAG TPA: PTS sucrose transporter subunit IIBC [Ktedonobacteraceae bacterium]|nr:PTS sucrose transporter subunit IIBC [Ktedonobacteraceae bacterium]
MGGLTLIIMDNQGIFLADLFGLLLSLPTALFLAFWMSAVKRKAAVVIGAFVGAFLGFVVILGWVGELIYDTVLPGATSGSTFFGSVLICSAAGLVFGILADLLVARLTRKDYRRPSAITE